MTQGSNNWKKHASDDLEYKEREKGYWEIRSRDVSDVYACGVRNAVEKYELWEKADARIKNKVCIEKDL